MAIPVQITYSITFVIYFLSILIHLFVLSEKLSYKLINGGRSESIDAQKKQSIVSIVILLIFACFMFVTFLIPNFRTSILALVIIILLTLFWLMGTVMQLLGTKFEKKVVVWINLLGFLTHLSLVISHFG